MFEIVDVRVQRSLDEHRWTFRGYAVTQLLLDPSSFRFQAWRLDGALEVRLGVPFTLVTPGGEQALDPEATERLAPALALLRRPLESLVVTRGGALAVAFAGGWAIRADPHPAYEAWEAAGSGALAELGYLCGVGGGSPWGRQW